MEQLQLEGYDDTRKGIYYFIPDEESLEEVKGQLKLNLDDFGQNAQSELNTKEKLSDISIGEYNEWVAKTIRFTLFF